MFGARFHDEEMEGATKGKEFRRIISFFRNKPLLITSLIISGITGGSSLLGLLVMEDGVSMFMDALSFLDNAVNMIKKSAWITAIMIFLQVLSGGIQSIVAPLFLVDIRKQLYDSLMHADISFFDHTSSGALVGRLSEGVAYIQDVYVNTLFITVNALVSALGGFIVGLVYGYKYIFMFIGFPIILCLVMWGGNKWADHVFNQYKTAGTESTEKAVSILTEFRTVKAFDQEMKESNDFRSELMNERSILTKVSLIRGLTECLSIATLIAMALTIIWYMFKQMVEDPESMPMFDMSCIIMGIFMLTIGIKMALGMSDNFLSAKSAARNICAIIELKPEIDPKKGRKIKDVKGKIEFRDVSFRYKGCEQYALKNLSFVINAGETVAFVGESGCGKSTTLQLLQRFYEIESGQILVDDVDIREISPRSLRSNISIVPQTPVLFSMTIADNIKYGRHTASDEEAAQAATTGNAHNFIMELPENYRTKVMQTSLSGGQKQRICISRAILSPTPILLLDEATAALDTESEQLVQQSLENFRHNNTCIMVAHRLATVLNSDRILVFKDGCIAESGTHKELLAANGIYSDLSRFQLQ